MFIELLVLFIFHYEPQTLYLLLTTFKHFALVLDRCSILWRLKNILMKVRRY